MGSTGVAVAEGTGEVEQFRTGGVVLPRGSERAVLPSGALEFGGESVDRGACWAELGPRTRDRVVELAGPSVGWWAVRREMGGQRAVQAGLLGEKAFVVAEPRLDLSRRVGFAVHAYVLEPGSTRHVTVESRPQKKAASAPPSGSKGRPAGLGEWEAKTIGSMPARAQQLLLEPFVRGEPVLRCEIYYWGNPSEARIFVVVLAGEHTVTSAVGSRFVPARHDEATAHWDLVCRRALVARRIGR